ncbi:MAG: hypothetical protein GX022_07730 [Clostridiaceae bacterium]|nr:hypothetical protein [Clostridiaceae bacterium]
MATKFLKYIRKHPSSKTQMPVIHSTAGMNLRGCIKERKLKATLCPVFKEYLLYFFMAALLINMVKMDKLPNTGLFVLYVNMIQ